MARMQPDIQVDTHIRLVLPSSPSILSEGTRGRNILLFRLHSDKWKYFIIKYIKNMDKQKVFARILLSKKLTVSHLLFRVWILLESLTVLYTHTKIGVIRIKPRRVCKSTL